ncbi:L-aspartate oxidase [Flavobacterium sp. DGU11]|uniref:L-aspartate oxidase n=1 Tax=Flavobacterium arundinis TaxID=3139143 RepID=A0ABU9HUK2_9FLAO
MVKTDILVIGTGIAGLSFAIKTAMKRADLHITIMTKDTAEVTNTRYAQGGIAAVMDRLNDSFNRHVQDTLQAGGGFCDQEVVRMVVHQAPDRLQELVELGVKFDMNNNQWDLALEGGHTAHRILHHGDITGLEIESALLNAVHKLSNITLLEKHFVIDLVVEKDNSDKKCIGAFYFDDTNIIRYIRAKETVLSTGGCGQVFRNTTNSHIATGDGVAIAYRANALVEDMQYIQFHPTALYEPGKNPYFLLTEALRGSGAHVVNDEGKRFLFQYDVRGELATRDIVSKAIGTELQKSCRQHVYLDCRHIDRHAFKTHFPAILSYCTGKGMDPFTSLLPIVPVAHYQCGGVTVNKHGQTRVTGLYAIGECAKTGLHGSNRLASNSLLEAVVYAHQAAEKICSTIDDMSFSAKVYIRKYHNGLLKADNRKINAIKKELQEIMASYNADNDSSNTALARLKDLKYTTSSLYNNDDLTVPIIELINMLTVATLIIEHSKKNNLITF